MMRKTGIASIAAGSLLVAMAVVAALLCIWTGDDRWGSTGLLTVYTGVPLVGIGIVLVQR